MIKFWNIKKKRNIDIILVNETSVFKGKIKNEELNHFSKLIENKKIPENLFEIPFSYIKKIESQENKNYIKIYFGKESEEELICENENLKKEIFNYLKENISTLGYSKEIPSIIKYAKPQLFSILVTLGIFLWSLYYAIQIESGIEYELKGTAGLGAIIYSIGLLGVFKVVLLFLLLIGILVYSLIKKIQSRSEIEQLSRNK
tara:strand:+ start:1666 stop:2271 length:606 start_codon:yes stop_codon:yes gene_type:complete